MTDDERIKRLEQVVAKTTVRRAYKSLRWGIQLFLGLLGLGAAAYGLGLGIEASARGRAVEAGAQVAVDEALSAQCAAACEAANMSLNRAIVREKRVIACGCVSPHGHRTLWDDRPRQTPAPQLCSMEHGDLVCTLDSAPARVLISTPTSETTIPVIEDGR